MKTDLTKLITAILCILILVGVIHATLTLIVWLVLGTTFKVEITWR